MSDRVRLVNLTAKLRDLLLENGFEVEKWLSKFVQALKWKICYQ
jgi:hypothetical protein